MLHEYGKRLSHAQTLAEAYQQKFDAGNANALEYNKARLNLATAQGEYQRLMTERNTLLEQLASLNGGEAIALNDSVFAAVLPPADFEAWYAEAENRSPMLQYVRQQVEVANADARLSKAEWLPELKVGYMTEGLSSDYYQGLSVGVSVYAKPKHRQWLRNCVPTSRNNSSSPPCGRSMPPLWGCKRHGRATTTHYG